MNPMNDDPAHTPPLCVDLDGTLCKSDCLFETLFAALRKKPSLLFSLPRLLGKGIPFLKSVLAAKGEIDYRRLPYREDLLSFLKAEKSKGRKLILVTAAHHTIAEAAVRELEIFDAFFASDQTVNLKGKRKAALLVKEFGKGGFDYIGNEKVDIPVWKEARKALLVSPPPRLLRGIEKSVPGVIPIGPAGKSKLLPAWRALRPWQWTKNLLVYVPLFVDHSWRDPENFLVVGLGFASLSLCASSGYMINDLLDLNADRANAGKSKRPFAAGDLPLEWGLAAVPLLLLAGFFLAFAVNPAFAGYLGLYFLLTTLYSFLLKRKAILDVLTLAGLYSIRVWMGGVCLHLTLSAWLIAFSMFIFLSLAFAKRYSELYNLSLHNEKRVEGRGYRGMDLSQIASFGTASGYLSVLVIALYINSPESVAVYRHPRFLWAICPVLLYWISRIWLLSHRGQMNEDPILFALGDKTSYLVGLIILLIPLLAGPV